MALTVKESLLSVVLVITLTTGILMALFISFVLKPIQRTESDQYITIDGLNMLEIDKKCACNVTRLDKIPMLPMAQQTINSQSRKIPKELNKYGNILKDVQQSVKQKQDEISKFVKDKTKGTFRSKPVYEKIKDDNGTEFKNESYDIRKTEDIEFMNKTTSALAVAQRTVSELKFDDEQLSHQITNNRIITRRRIVREVSAPHCMVPNVNKPKLVSKTKKSTWNFESYLVSISAPRFLDDEDDRYYLCSGAIIDEKRVITGQKCIRNRSKKTLKIRSNSSYWSIEGTLHDIVHISYTSELAILEAFPYFNLYWMPPLQMVPNYSDAEEYSTSAGWFEENKQKFSHYSVTKWWKYCSHCQLPSVKNHSECETFLGDPLINIKGSLIGVRACGNEFIGISEIAIEIVSSA